MDADQFDRLVARLVAAQSRRQALTGVVGGTLSTLGVTVVAESRRKRANGAAKNRGKHEDRNANQRNDKAGRQDDDSAERLGRRNRKRKRDRHKEHKRDEKKKNKKKNAQRQDRCRKNGQPCVRDSKCCSKHCDPNSGTCTRKPGS